MNKLPETIGGGYDEFEKLATEAQAFAVHLENHSLDLALYGRPAERAMAKQAANTMARLADVARLAGQLRKTNQKAKHAITQMLNHPKPIHGFVGESMEAKLYDAALACGRVTLADLEKLK